MSSLFSVIMAIPVLLMLELGLMMKAAQRGLVPSTMELATLFMFTLLALCFLLDASNKLRK